MSEHMKDVMWRGDWSSLTDEVCQGDGHLEVWDQTIGCPVCGQNLWFLPMTPEQWPAWSEDRPTADNWDRDEEPGHNPYDVYMRLFQRRHPSPVVDVEDIEPASAPGKASE